MCTAVPGCNPTLEHDRLEADTTKILQRRIVRINDRKTSAFLAYLGHRSGHDRGPREPVTEPEGVMPSDRVVVGRLSVLPGLVRGVTDDEATARHAAETYLHSGQARSAAVEKAHAVLGIRSLTSGYERTGTAGRPSAPRTAGSRGRRCPARRNWRRRDP